MTTITVAGPVLVRPFRVLDHMHVIEAPETGKMKNRRVQARGRMSDWIACPKGRAIITD